MTERRRRKPRPPSPQKDVVEPRLDRKLVKSLVLPFALLFLAGLFAQHHWPTITTQVARCGVDDDGPLNTAVQSSRQSWREISNLSWRQVVEQGGVAALYKASMPVLIRDSPARQWPSAGWDPEQLQRLLTKLPMVSGYKACEHCFFLQTGNIHSFSPRSSLGPPAPILAHLSIL